MNGKRSYKLMIVDDSNIMRRRIERSQQFEELELVGTAANGVDALELFKKTDPDVVTMDLTMPRMDGIETLRQLRLLAPTVPVVLTSGYGAGPLEDQPPGAEGPDAVLAKPYLAEELLATIRRVMRRSPRG